MDRLAHLVQLWSTLQGQQTALEQAAMAGVYQGDAHNKIAELRSILPRQIAAFRHNLAMAEQLNAVGVAASANRGIEAYIKRLELIR